MMLDNAQMSIVWCITCMESVEARIEVQSVPNSQCYEMQWDGGIDLSSSPASVKLHVFDASPSIVKCHILNPPLPSECFIWINSLKLFTYKINWNMVVNNWLTLSENIHWWTITKHTRPALKLPGGTRYKNSHNLFPVQLQCNQ